MYSWGVNQDHYEIFINALEHIADKIVKKTGRKLSKRLLYEYLNERAN